MKLVIDSKIPYMQGFAELLGDVTYLPGATITAADVRDADALIIRTRTHCNRELLAGSKVKFIATATIGFDHIDLNYLKEAGIGWTNCPGCNASSVRQYITSCILLLAAHGAFRKDAVLSPLTAPIAWPLPAGWNDFSALTFGVVGVGQVGSRVAAMAHELGFGKVLLCDPPRAEREGTAGFTELSELVAQADVISCHTPLTRAPWPHPTYHLIDEACFGLMKPGAVFFNAGRGEVVRTEALKEALTAHRLRTAVIDTWEQEPNIDLDLLHKVFIGTPHIAGYSADGKANGTRMALQAVASHFGMDPQPFAAVSAPTLPPHFRYYEAGTNERIDPRLALYDPTRDYNDLLAHPECFEQLRGNYPLRREQGEA